MFVLYFCVYHIAVHKKASYHFVYCILFWFHKKNGHMRHAGIHTALINILLYMVCQRTTVYKMSKQAYKPRFRSAALERSSWLLLI